LICATTGLDTPRSRACCDAQWDCPSSSDGCQRRQKPFLQSPIRPLLLLAKQRLGYKLQLGVSIACWLGGGFQSAMPPGGLMGSATQLLVCGATQPLNQADADNDVAKTRR